MLFNYYFNWIKYKTLPPSLLYRNRLFVERDSKHRRVMVNLGVTFRNSKWSSYGRKNISLQFVHKYLRNLGVFAFAVLLMFFFNPTNLLDNVWGALDTTLSNFLFGYFFLLATLHTVVNNLYTTLLGKLIGGTNLNTTQSNLNSKPTLSVNQSPLPASSEQLLVYNWLKQPSAQPSLLDVFGNSTTATPKVALTKSLFNLTSTLTLLKSTSSNTDGLLAPHEEQGLLNSTEFTSQALSLQTNLVKSDNVTSAKTLAGRFQWSLPFAESHAADLEPVFYNRKGTFYTQSLTPAQINSAMAQYSEALITPQVLSAQKSIIQRNAWLYKFSNLNRTSLTHAKNLTRTKSFLSSTSTPFLLETKNIWAANELNLSNNLSGLQRSLTPSQTAVEVKHSPFTYLNSTNSTLQFNSNVKTFESSYFWLLKRLYLFNNLQASRSSLTIQPSSKESLLATHTVKLGSDLPMFTTALLSNPVLATDFTVGFHPTHSSTGSVNSKTGQPLTLFYSNSSLYTSSFSKLVSTFESNLASGNRTALYNSPLQLTNTSGLPTFTTLDGVSGTSAYSKPENSLGISRDAVFLADLKLFTLLFSQQ